ncbi:MAG TPA: cation:proton antiporter [Candidatus Angelobacter sp.]
MTPNPTESVVLTITIQLVVILLAARGLGGIFRRIGQPQVCGEIAAGLLLGPSVFGVFLPRVQHLVFNPSGAMYLDILSQVGLIFVMFLIGLDFDFGYLRGSRRAACSISAAGIVVPFVLGLLIGPVIWKQMDLQVDLRAFVLFFATALSITAMPVLGRILIEFNINRTRLGALAISAAAMEDAVGWLLLAMVSAIVTSHLQPLRLFLAALEAVVYLLAMIFVIRPLMLKWIRWAMPEESGELSWNALAQLIAFFLTSAAITNLIGIFSLFGAFVMGAILYDQKLFRDAVNSRMRDFVSVFFLPVFFTYTGLRTDIHSAGGASIWLVCLVVVLAASVGKVGACASVAKLSGLSWRDACSIGVMMNTRGLMELVVLNAGYDLGVIPKPMFFVLVIMAVVTTYATAPILRRLIQGVGPQAQFESSALAERAAS